METAISIATPTPTVHGVDNGLDVSVTILVTDLCDHRGRNSRDDLEVGGQVTLIPSILGGYDAWGQPDHWCSPALLDGLASLTRLELSCVLHRIASAAAVACDKADRWNTK